MWIVSLKKLKEFWTIHRDAEDHLVAWYDLMKEHEWQNFSAIKRLWRSADQVGSCIVFDICGNKYRLIVTMSRERKKMYIREIITHKEYDRDKWKRHCGTQP